MKIDKFHFVIRRNGVYVAKIPPCNLLEDGFLEALEKAKQIHTEQYKGKRADKGSFVYLFGLDIPNVYKIGLSSDPDKRISDSSHAVTVLWSVFFEKRKDAYRCEANLKDRYRELKPTTDQLCGAFGIHNEWFVLPQSELDILMNIDDSDVLMVHSCQEIGVPK